MLEVWSENLLYLTAKLYVRVFFHAERPWPVAFGAGVGLGMGYSNCQHDFMHPNLLHGKLKKVFAIKKVFVICRMLIIYCVMWWEICHRIWWIMMPCKGPYISYVHMGRGARGVRLPISSFIFYVRMVKNLWIHAYISYPSTGMSSSMYECYTLA